MIEAFAGIGVVCTFFICLGVIGLLIEWSIVHFKQWRKHNCKFKCLCKHTYEIKWIDGHYDMMIVCKICGKAKKLHFSGESLEAFRFKFNF